MNGIVLQTGGPTAVLNASLWGVIHAWQQSLLSVGAGGPRPYLWGARHGLRGLMADDWVDLTDYRDQPAAPLAHQPGAALGGGRDRLTDTNLPQVLRHLRRHAIEAVFVLGGNGSMAAAQRLAEAAGATGYQVGGAPLRVLGVPKTVDNDLVGTDFAPGYPSAARFLAQTVLDIGLDLRSMAGFDQVAIVEVMGRHAGWLAAATALARTQFSDPPHLILLPEVPLDEDAFLRAVQTQVERGGVCLVVASEGVRDTAGEYLTEKGQTLQRDASGQRMLGFGAGVAAYLARLIGARIGLRCRQMRLDTVQRSSRSLVSQVDRYWAQAVGEAAIRAALDGQSDIMMGLARTSPPPPMAEGPGGRVLEAHWQVSSVPFTAVVGQERTFPLDWHTPPFDIATDFLDYARPLVDGWQPAAPVDLAGLR